MKKMEFVVQKIDNYKKLLLLKKGVIILLLSLKSYLMYLMQKQINDYKKIISNMEREGKEIYSEGGFSIIILIII